MPGMSSGLNANDPTIVAAFEAALRRQGLVVLAILSLLAIAWWFLRNAELRRAGASRVGLRASVAAGSIGGEPRARRLLRISFGILWIFDGILQTQPKMPLGMTTAVIEPAAAASPHWVQHVANAGATIWSYHPIAAPASAVWIQIGLGIWLIVAPRGLWSRLGGLASAGWGLLVWVFGEAFGGIFAPGLSWMFGAPGAVLFYSFAGVLIALPERWWASPRLGRAVLGVMGAFFIGMAVLQAWPGRGFWEGHLGHTSNPGTLSGMVDQMSQTSQPNFLASWLATFGSFGAAHGFAVNLFVVISLGLLGLAFLSGRTSIVCYAAAAGVVLCLADWVLVEDLGFLGGVGTDPNSMIPMSLVFVAGYYAIAKLPVTSDAVVPLATRAQRTRTLRERIEAWGNGPARQPAYLLRSLSALAAIGVILVGAAPMALASLNPTADPIIAQAIDGTPGVTNYVAPNFRLVDQNGHVVTLAGLRGNTIALTFLDPVCVSQCPIIAQEFAQASRMLGSAAQHLVLISIVANPLYRARDYLVAFDRTEGLDRLRNWLYLTGSSSELRRVWNAFGVQVQYSPGGSMVAHSEIAYVIDVRGHVRSALNTDPGNETAASQSSFAVTLANEIRRVMGST